MEEELVTHLCKLPPPAGPLLHVPRPQRRPDVSPRRRLPGAARRRGPRGCGGPGTAVIAGNVLFVCRLNISLFTYLYQVEIHQGEYLDQGRAVTQQYSDYSHNVFDYQFSGSQFSGL